MPKAVLLLTSTNLACNPRCLKEVRLLVSKDIKVTVVAFKLHNWSDKMENELVKELNSVEFHYLESTKIHLSRWLFSSILERFAFVVAPIFQKNIFIQAMAVSKRSWLLLNWLKKWKGNSDLIIAHNPAAFYPAYYLFKKTHIPFALDVEDYHPGEGKNKYKQLYVSLLMKKLISNAIYTSYASPLIKSYTEDLVGQTDKSRSIIVNNIFSSCDFILTNKISDVRNKINFVWFSQIIDYSRGLEQIFKVLDTFRSEVSLTLIGNLRDDFFEKEIKNRPYIKIVEPLSQKELNLMLSNFDVGLALENTEADFNRSICLTNKIWAYFQAGLYILATDTMAQSDFINNFPEHGISTQFTQSALEKAVIKILQNSDEIKDNKIKRYAFASNNGWEKESLKLHTKWNKILF